MRTEHHELSFPERDLWLAVVERAVRDYCFFFDKLFHTAAKDLWGRKVETNLNINKGIRELNILRWFFFAKEPEQFNLQFIVESLYDNYDDMAHSIRTSVSEQFKRHVEEVAATGQFKQLIEYIQKETTAMNAKTATFKSNFKNRRFRTIN